VDKRRLSEEISDKNRSESSSNHLNEDLQCGALITELMDCHCIDILADRCIIRLKTNNVYLR